MKASFRQIQPILAYAVAHLDEDVRWRRSLNAQRSHRIICTGCLLRQQAKRRSSLHCDCV